MRKIIEGVSSDKTENEHVRSLRRKYQPPVLVEYGSIAKLTQTTQKSGGDEDGAAAMMAVGCL